MLKIFGLKKQKIYVLMHKNVPVLSAEYDKDRAEFTAITAIHSFAHVPYTARNADGTVDLKNLNHWFRWRGIPGYRVGLERLLNRLNVDSPRQLLSAYYGLSVSDHYWLREEDDQFGYEQVNFFHHRFDQDGFGKAMFSFGTTETHASALRTPNSTLAGYQKKAWFHRGNQLVLLKGGSFLYQLEPIHEQIASMMAKRLGIDAVEYTTEIYENQVVSVCNNMLDLEHELITADDVLSIHVPEKGKFHYYNYLDTLREMGINNVTNTMDDMIVLDFLMMNTDRHNQNFGVIINADTMKWEKIAPVFDTGTGLACLKFDEEVMSWPKNYVYRFFNAKDVTDEVAVYLIRSLKRYDFSVLEDMPDIYAKLMAKYKVITGISDSRIERQKRLLQYRIDLIRKVQALK